MSKRPNPHRRLLAQQARALADARLEQSRLAGADMAKLQQGAVRSHMGRGNATSATYREPNWTSEDAKPKRGKVVRGTLVRVNPHKAERFGVKK